MTNLLLSLLYNTYTLRGALGDLAPLKRNQITPDG